MVFARLGFGPTLIGVGSSGSRALAGLIGAVAARPGIDRLVVAGAARYLLASLGFTAFSRAGAGRVERRWLRSCKEMRFGVKGIKSFERTASQGGVIDARWSRVFPETNLIVGGTGALAQLRGMLGRNGRGSPGIPFGTCIVAYAEERNGQVPARQTTMLEYGAE